MIARSKLRALAPIAILPVALVACGSLLGGAFDDLETNDAGSPDSSDGAIDGAMDGAIDAAIDGAIDAAIDGAIDAAIDGAIDAAIDAGRDVDSGEIKEADSGIDGRTDADASPAMPDAAADSSDGAVAPWTESFELFTLDQPIFEPGAPIALTEESAGTFDLLTMGNGRNLWSTGKYGGAHWNLGVAVNEDKRFVLGGGVASVSPDAQSTFVFALDTSAVLYQAAGWSAGQPLPSTRVQPVTTDPNMLFPGGGLAAVATKPGEIFVLTIGLDGALWVAGHLSAGTWSAPSFAALGLLENFHPGGAVAAVTDGDTIHAYTIGLNGVLYSAGIYASGAWHTGDLLNFGVGVDINSFEHFAPGSNLAITRQNGLLEVWVIGNDGRLWNAGSTRDQNGNFWTRPYEVPVPPKWIFSIGGGIAVKATDDGSLQFYSIGFSNHLWSVTTFPAGVAR